MAEILNIVGLTKYYGHVHAVDNLDLNISEGQVYGVLGPNGSGKTTTLSVVLGTVRPTRGQFQWFDSSSLKEVRKKIGIVTETSSFYPYLSGYQNLKLIAEIKECDKNRILKVLELAGLFERRNHSFRNYSFGMKQRLSFAAALLPDPDVLVLDEPTNGMDPQGIHDVRELILQASSEGKTIILASHLLDEVQKVCSHVAVIQKGKKIFDGAVEKILEDENQVVIEADDVVKLEKALAEFKGIRSSQKVGKKIVVELHPGPEIHDLHKHLIDGGVLITQFSENKATLESKFLELLNQSK
ncbi:ABC transporter ATP-binding protein [Bacteroidota bacterium]